MSDSIHASTGAGASGPADDARDVLERGPFPQSDGWGAVYRLFDRMAPVGSPLRRAVCSHFWPHRWEPALYRWLGVPLFGTIIPTGGVAVRRLTGARMAPYTLRGPSPAAAREFFYRTCVFEAAHTPFLLALLAITIRQVLAGRIDLAAEDLLVNLAVNIYPIMHHRRTRARIISLVERSIHRAPLTPAPPVHTGRDALVER